MTGPRALPLALSTLAVLASGCGGATFPTGSNVLGASSIEWAREPHPMTRERELRFESDATSTISRLDPAGSLPVRRNYFDGETAVRLEAVCTAPCAATLGPAWYIVTGGDVVQTQAFRIPDDAAYVRVKAGGSQTMREIGIGATFVGLVVVALGGMAAAMAGPHGADGGSIGLLVTGGVGIGLGLPLWLLNPPTRVSFGASASSRSSRSSRDSE
jgi:hypothetical protein